MKNREAYFDQLRVLAIFSIVCCHVSAGFLTKNVDLMMHAKTFYSTLLVNSGRFIGVPMFVMLSGALLINKNYSLSTFVKKRLNRVFVPFIFWVIIFILFSVVFLHESLTYDLVFKVFFGLKGSIGTILWFIWMLMIVYIAIFIINKLLEYAKSRSYEQKCINALVAASLICYIVYNLIHIPYEMISYYCLFIPYAIFGYYLTHAEFTHMKMASFNITAKRIVISASVLSVICYLYFVMTVYLKSIAMNNFFSASYFDFAAILFNFSIMLFFRYLPKSEGAVSKKVNAFLTSGHMAKAILSVSLCSYGIYFVHYLILTTLQVLYLYSVSYLNHPTFWVPVLVVVVFLSSWAVIWIISKVPYLNKVSGAS